MHTVLYDELRRPGPVAQAMKIVRTKAKATSGVPLAQRALNRHISMYMYICSLDTHTSICTHILVHAYLHTSIGTYILVCMCVLYIYMYLYARLSTCAHIHIHMYISIHV